VAAGGFQVLRRVSTVLRNPATPQTAFPTGIVSEEVIGAANVSSSTPSISITSIASSEVFGTASASASCVVPIFDLYVFRGTQLLASFDQDDFQVTTNPDSLIKGPNEFVVTVAATLVEYSGTDPFPISGNNLLLNWDIANPATSPTSFIFKNSLPKPELVLR